MTKLNIKFNRTKVTNSGYLNSLTYFFNEKVIIRLTTINEILKLKS